MNEAVIPELELLLFSVLSGALCFAGYDILLAARVFFRQNVVFEKLFDLFYWASASILVFSMIHAKNSGVVRGYSVAGMLAGMILYRLAAKDRLVLWAGRLAKRIRAWFSLKWEPVKKKKMELRIRRKKCKIERRQRRRERREHRARRGDKYGEDEKKKKKNDGV